MKGGVELQFTKDEDLDIYQDIFKNIHLHKNVADWKFFFDDSKINETNNSIFKLNESFYEKIYGTFESFLKALINNVRYNENELEGSIFDIKYGKTLFSNPFNKEFNIDYTTMVIPNHTNKHDENYRIENTKICPEIYLTFFEKIILNLEDNNDKVFMYYIFLNEFSIVYRLFSSLINIMFVTSYYGISKIMFERIKEQLKETNIIIKPTKYLGKYFDNEKIDIDEQDIKQIINLFLTQLSEEQTSEEKPQTSEEKSQTSEEKSQTSEEKPQTSEENSLSYNYLSIFEKLYPINRSNYCYFMIYKYFENKQNKNKINYLDFIKYSYYEIKKEIPLSRHLKNLFNF